MYHVSRSTRQFSGLFFCPSMGHVAAMFQAVQTRMFTGLRTPGCFSAPEAVLSEVKQRFDCVLAQTHLLSEFGGGFSPPILNRIPLLQVQYQTHSTDRMLEVSQRTVQKLAIDLKDVRGFVGKIFPLLAVT